MPLIALAVLVRQLVCCLMVFFQLHPWYVYDSHNQIAEVKGTKTYWIFVSRNDADRGQNLSRFCPHFL